MCGGDGHANFDTLDALQNLPNVLTLCFFECCEVSESRMLLDRARFSWPARWSRLTLNRGEALPVSSQRKFVDGIILHPLGPWGKKL